MSWIQDLASLTKRLLTLEDRVTRNAENLERLRQDFEQLKKLTHDIGYVVKRNQTQAETWQENLVLRLENQLLKFENRLSGSD